METLIKALQILHKYGNPEYPTHCEHDRLLVLIDPAKVSKEDIKQLDKMEFYPDFDEGYFYSFKYGSA